MKQMSLKTRENSEQISPNLPLECSLPIGPKNRLKFGLAFVLHSFLRYDLLHGGFQSYRPFYFDYWIQKVRIKRNQMKINGDEKQMTEWNVYMNDIRDV